MPAAERYWVGYSGGLDSTVLLHMLAERRADPPGPLMAIHLNHGLQPAADAWQQHCQSVCRALAVELTVERVQVSVGQGESLEAASRARLGKELGTSSPPA